MIFILECVVIVEVFFRYAIKDTPINLTASQYVYSKYVNYPEFI